MISAALVWHSHACGQLTLKKEADTLSIDRGLAVSSVGESARRPINTDDLISRVVLGTLDLGNVKAGDELSAGKAWSEVSGEGEGFASVGRSTYVLAKVQSERARVMLMDATGHGMVYVNGEPRVGDPYGHGYVTLPVLLREGENTMLFAHAGRGRLRASLRKPASGAVLLERDLTLPDARPDGEGEWVVGVPMVNASEVERTLVLRADAGAGEARSEAYRMAACTVLKGTVRVRVPKSETEVALRLEILEGDRVLTAHTATLGSPRAGSAYKITYTSRVDGSAQYASIVPAPADGSPFRPALVLSLHGASVEATNQAASYAPRAGYVIACPTNRRPYGFDWEDWGRIDAIEVMDLVKERFGTDAARQYLTGHSMGGHGTWNIGTLYPERFAAIAPSAGWLSFETYTSRGGPAYAPEGALGEVFRAARASSDTPALMGNLRGKGIYILHGDADDNVPIDQARQARTILDQMKIAYAFHEQAGAGHWWDDDQPGAACLDWPGIWETFAAHRLKDEASRAEVPPPIDARGFARGSFKRAFDHEFVLVYSTAGTAEENAWSMAKARFDAEQWWYRGNGLARVLSDAQFNAMPTNGNVIVYGHRSSNLAWNTTVRGARLNLEPGRLSIAGNTLTGDDLAFLAVVPRGGMKDRLVGIVGGTGLAGMRATDRLNYFTSGVGFPDVTIGRATMWQDGYSGVVGAGNVEAVVWSPEEKPK